LGVGGQRKGKIHVRADRVENASVECPHCQVPSKPSGSDFLLSQSKSGLADGNHLLPLLLEGLGDFEAAKKYCGPLAVLLDASPAVMHPGAANRFFLCVCVGSSVSVSGI
jgi:hypothetical protein